MSKLIGEWQTAGVTIDFLGKRLTDCATNAMKEAGEDLADVMRGHIDKQDLGWTPLAEYTVRMKGSDVIYIETGDLYRNAFKVRQLKATKKGSSFFVGANPWTKHKPSGQKMNVVLTELEYGTEKIPPRPIVRPSYEEFQRQLPKRFAKYMKLELGKGGLV